MTRQIFLATGLVLAWTAAASAAPLSRADTVARALEANPDVMNALEERLSLEARRDEALADALPQISLLLSASRFRDPSLLNSGSFDSFPPELRSSLLPQAVPLYDGALQLRQTLWSFRLGSAIKAARLARLMGDAQVRYAEAAVALEAVRAYNAFLLSRERFAVGEKAVALQEAHVKMAQLRRDAGVATDLEVLRSQVSLENQRAELLRLRGANDWDRGTLNAVMLRPIDAPIEPSDTLDVVALDATLEETTRAALASRPEIEIGHLNQDVQDQLVMVERAEGRPRLDLLGSYGTSVREGGNFGDADYVRWSAGVTITIPIFDGRRTHARVAQARAARAKADHDLVRTENQIRLEAEQSFDRLRTAHQVFDAAELNVAQARRALQMTEASYKLGAVTILDVLDAQSAHTLAEVLRLEALHAHADARARLRSIMGQSPLDPTLTVPADPEPPSTP